jgi:hypothetical protein
LPAIHYLIHCPIHYAIHYPIHWAIHHPSPYLIHYPVHYRGLQSKTGKRGNTIRRTEHGGLAVATEDEHGAQLAAMFAALRFSSDAGVLTGGWAGAALAGVAVAKAVRTGDGHNQRTR